MKTYSPVSSEAERAILKMKGMYHEDLQGVTVTALFVYDDEESSAPALKHGGYPAAATIRITSVKDRALGIADAVIIIDRATWLSLKTEACEALIDHELTHLERVLDEETGKPKWDVLNRPKLAMKLHDRQMGWFDDVARRHGDFSPEVRQAKALLSETSQLYFNFGPPAAVQPTAPAESGAAPGGEEQDPKYSEALSFVTSCGLDTVGVSRIQTELKIGYNRAARLLEALETAGHVGPMQGHAGRTIVRAETSH